MDNGTVIPLFPRAPRPPWIQCDKYVAGTGTRCAYYLDGGPCVRPDEFMCVEWLRVNHPPRPAHPLPDVPARDEALAHLRSFRAEFARAGGAR